MEIRDEQVRCEVTLVVNRYVNRCAIALFPGVNFSLQRSRVAEFLLINQRGLSQEASLQMSVTFSVYTVKAYHR